MRKTTLRSFVLLFIFFSFLITQYPGGHVASLTDHEHHAVISSDTIEVFLLKDDIKKYFIKPDFSTEVLFIFIIALSLFCSKLIWVSRKAVLFTPIFYQSNYVDDAPSCE
ncbi:hypothetical protein [Bacillus sp. S/N-304-OC-R1]|uniref:hypothetical protein n=1 Tax=Bacillus sp. S/N-304-OC-R1 TaxID=2758034 RepID=UPI001C8E8CC1|nr:hypothetical protein [Bacillus sp. S/N-304-OC-R1]MBY0122038.1 hypothetical protein [Bacillus sp. S/N-304-OC-R1]